MINKNLRIVFFGTPEFVVQVAKNLAKEFDLIGVVTAPDKPVGRKQEMRPSAVKQWLLGCHAELVSASSNQSHSINPGRSRNKPLFKRASLAFGGFGMTMLTPEKLDMQFLEEFSRMKPDLAIVAAYGLIIPQDILDVPKYGFLNIHPSLLPKYRGASPIQSAILNGDEISGITIIKMDSQMDHGPIVFQEEFRLSEQDDFSTLSTKMFGVGSKMLSEGIIEYISGRVIPTEQDHNLASFCGRIGKEDGYFDINNPPSPTTLDRMIRAYYPWPTAWTKWRVQSSEFRVQSEKQDRIVKLLPGNLVQIEGKKPTPLPDFLRGYPDFPIKTFPG